jgi:plasmid stability protein
MDSLTISNIDEPLKTLLRERAARHGCTVEQEAGDILRRAVSVKSDRVSFAQKVCQRFADLNADELLIPARRATRKG